MLLDISLYFPRMEKTKFLKAAVFAHFEIPITITLRNFNPLPSTILSKFGLFAKRSSMDNHNFFVSSNPIVSCNDAFERKDERSSM